MRNIYEAHIEGNKVQWIDIPPKGILENKKIKMKVILSEEPVEKKNRGKVMADTLQKIADISGLKSIRNPVSWQKNIRKDRSLR